METINPPTLRVSALTSTLDTLLNDQKEGIHISIYQPAGRLPEDAERARIQLRTHLQEVRRLLTKDGCDEDVIDKTLRSAEELSQANDDFWQHQEGGLALFIDEEDTRTLSVARPFDNRAVVSCEYHLKPMMALAANADAYHLLTLSQNEVKLLRGSALGIREMEVEGLPASYAAAMDKLGYPPDSFAASAAESNLKVDKERLKIFFKEIDAAVFPFLQGSEWPLLVAGDVAYEPIYRDVNRYPHLSEAYLPGNPEHVEIEELHRTASGLLKHDFIESQKRALLQLAKVEPPENVQTSLTEALASATQGRVATLVVPLDKQCWGAYDPDENSVHTSEVPGLSNVDLYETTARLCLLHGGEVFFIKAVQIPHGDELLALLRW